MTLTELAMAKPGETVGHVRHGGGQLIDTDVARGLVPESSDLAAKDARVYVATNSLGGADVVIGLEHIRDGEAELGIEAVQRGALRDPVFMQRLVIEAMAQSGVQHVSLDPGLATVPKEALPRIGFYPDASGDTYNFSTAV